MNRSSGIMIPKLPSIKLRLTCWILVPPIPRRPLLMYLAVNGTSMGCVLEQHDESERKKNQYITWARNLLTMNPVIPFWEKLVTSWHRQRRDCHYMLYHTTLFTSRMDPLRYLFEKPALWGRFAWWHLLLAEFDITYATKKLVKGQAYVDHLIEKPIDNWWRIYSQMNPSWALKRGGGI